MFMIDNADQPISKVRHFAETAENRGCYSKSQRGNFETAWTIFLKNVSDQVPSHESVPIQGILPLVEPVFRKYGNENKVSTTTVRAYQTRVKRLLEDFLSHNGGDFMAWKESLSRAANVGTKTRQRRKQVAEVAITTPPTFSTRSHKLVLSRNREGILTLPADLTEPDVNLIWNQLEALKTLTIAQIAAAKNNGDA
jgi:hypothetical protein